MLNRKEWKIALGENAFWASNICYGTSYSPEDVLSHSLELDYDGIELHLVYHNFTNSTVEVSGLKKKYAEKGLMIPAIQTSVGSLAEPNEKSRQKNIENLRKQILLAADIGATHSVALYPGGAPKGITKDKALRILINSYREVIEEAESLNVILNMEPEPPFIVNTPEITKEVLEEVDSKNFKIVWDFSHANIISKGKPLEFLSMIDGRIGWVHVTDNDGRIMANTLLKSMTSTHLPLGEGKIDYEAMIRALIKYGYSGWWQIDLWEYPLPLTGSRTSKEKLERVLNKAYRT
jgi:sugar phosphate isomerase/epimerase